MQQLHWNCGFVIKKYPYRIFLGVWYNKFLKKVTINWNFLWSYSICLLIGMSWVGWWFVFLGEVGRKDLKFKNHFVHQGLGEKGLRERKKYFENGDEGERSFFHHGSLKAFICWISFVEMEKGYIQQISPGIHNLHNIEPMRSNVGELVEISRCGMYPVKKEVHSSRQTQVYFHSIDALHLPTLSPTACSGIAWSWTWSALSSILDGVFSYKFTQKAPIQECPPSFWTLCTGVYLEANYTEREQEDFHEIHCISTSGLQKNSTRFCHMPHTIPNWIRDDISSGKLKSFSPRNTNFARRHSDWIGSVQCRKPNSQAFDSHWRI